MSNYPRLNVDEIKKIREIDFDNHTKLTDAETILSQEYGNTGTATRKEFDAKSRAWYYGEILKEQRKELKLTQKELAERIGRERSYINKIEKGETDIQLSTFIRILDALGIDISLTTRLA